MLVTQESKPHTAAVTAISVNQPNELLVTGGEDNTVFVYRLLDTGQLSPLGYWLLTGPARCLTWTPGKVTNTYKIKSTNCYVNFVISSMQLPFFILYKTCT